MDNRVSLSGNWEGRSRWTISQNPSYIATNMPGMTDEMPAFCSTVKTCESVCLITWDQHASTSICLIHAAPIVLLHAIAKNARV